MIRQLTGRVARKDGNSVVVAVSGVGFLLEVPASTRIPPEGETVTLWTHLRVREDALDLFGFGTPDELELFEAMIGVTRFPAKAALSVLSHVGVEGFRRAVAKGDVKALTGAPGVGSKTAQQLLLELRGKIDLEELPETKRGKGEPLDDPTLALIELGVPEPEARLRVKKARESNPEIEDTAEIVKIVLKKGR